MRSRFHRWIRRAAWPCGILVALIVTMTGCQTSRYYRQAIAGQWEILRLQKPIQRITSDPTTPAMLRNRLDLVSRIRSFAESELHLPADEHYLQYADLHRRFVVWNVYAAPEFSRKPKTWWYPFVGRLKYRGYFREADARSYAAKLEEKGYDVYVGGVQAYSTLGWFRDPVLNTFAFDSELELVELLFHELAHHVVFAKGDTDFSEAFATAVAEEGVRRWLLANGDLRSMQQYKIERERREEFVQLVSKAIAELERLYAGSHSSTGNSQVEDAQAAMRDQKKATLERMQREYEQLKVKWNGWDEYDGWFRGTINNAKLNTVDTYYRLVPAFHELLQRSGGDLAEFYETAGALAKRTKPERQAELQALLETSDSRDNVAISD